MEVFSGSRSIGSDTKRKIVVCQDKKELCQRAAELFLQLATQAVSVKGKFTTALSGGSTPRLLYSLLGSNRFQSRLPWSKLHLFWGDERCVPPDHPQSNYAMTRSVMLSKVPIPEENVYRIAAEKGASPAAAEYEQTLRKFFALAENERPCFDLILLGMGTDGHVASLFPGTAALRESRRFVTATYVEKLKAYRVTLTAPAINQAANVVFLISGEPKAPVLGEVLRGSYQPTRFPSQLIQPTQGKLLFLIDRAAASKLSATRET